MQLQTHVSWIIFTETPTFSPNIYTNMLVFNMHKNTTTTPFFIPQGYLKCNDKNNFDILVLLLTFASFDNNTYLITTVT